MTHGGITGGSSESHSEARSFVPKTIDETDAYTSTVAGTTVEAVRLGAGVRPNVVLGVPRNEVTVSAASIGFPMLNRSHIPDDSIVAAFIHSVDGESRWCGIELRPGTAVLYAPGAEHQALNRPGLRFSFAAAKMESLEDVISRTGLSFDMPRHGEVCVQRDSPATRSLGAALDGYTDAAISGRSLDAPGRKVLRTVVGLRPGGRQRSGAVRRRIDSRRIVANCIEFAESTGQIPTIRELCRVAYVSERRLRDAFTEQFDIPPSRFFRAWALDLAHRRLRDPGANGQSVTDIAIPIGFTHLGRFAGYYRKIYGELPSATLGGGFASADERFAG